MHGRRTKLLTLAGDLHVLTELAGLALDLDTVMEVLLKGSTVKDTVACWARVVDDELVLGGGLRGGLGLHRTERKENPV